MLALLSVVVGFAVYQGYAEWRHRRAEQRRAEEWGVALREHLARQNRRAEQQRRLWGV